MVIIYLTGALPVRLSDLPWTVHKMHETGNFASHYSRIYPNLILHQTGFVMPLHKVYPFNRYSKWNKAVISYITFSPLSAGWRTVCFLWHSPSPGLAGRSWLSQDILPLDVWTFLPQSRAITWTPSDLFSIIINHYSAFLSQTMIRPHDSQ